VIILDANILLFAYDRNAEKHEKARGWIEELFSSGTPVGIPWQTAHAFLRIITNPRMTIRRLTADDAVEIVDSWFAQPNIRFLVPGEEHWDHLRRMVIEGQAWGP
jgi:uncharacterized protein